MSSESKAITTSSNWGTLLRTNTLDDIVGQSDAVQTIRGFISRREVPSTILITGATGCGKTSLSRIIAREINEVDSECPILEHPDYYEINVGEYNGKDDAHKLISRSRYLPKTNFRVICLDEIHLASRQAMSTLLKPMEEPPPRTVWIMATDQPEKLPRPLVGRSCVLALSSPEPEEIYPLLRRALAAKNIKFETKKIKLKVIEQVAEAARGQPRTALNLLQNVVNLISGGSDHTQAIRNAVMASSSGTEEAAIKLLYYVYRSRHDLIVKTLNSFKAGEWVHLSYLLMDYNKYLVDLGCGVETYATPQRKELAHHLEKQKFSPETNTSKILAVHRRLVELRREIGTFLVPELHLFITKLTQPLER